eukprot:scaffold174637_cov31-Tisochrysis_lutea.AAC.5
MPYFDCSAFIETTATKRKREGHTRKSVRLNGSSWKDPGAYRRGGRFVSIAEYTSRLRVYDSSAVLKHQPLPSGAHMSYSPPIALVI